MREFLSVISDLVSLNESLQRFGVQQKQCHQADREKVKQIPDDDVKANDSVKMVERLEDGCTRVAAANLIGYIGSWQSISLDLHYFALGLHNSQDNRADLCSHPQCAGLNMGCMGCWVNDWVLLCLLKLLKLRWLQITCSSIRLLGQEKRLDLRVCKAWFIYYG